MGYAILNDGFPTLEEAESYKEKQIAENSWMKDRLDIFKDEDGTFSVEIE